MSCALIIIALCVCGGVMVGAYVPPSDDSSIVMFQPMYFPSSSSGSFDSRPSVGRGQTYQKKGTEMTPEELKTFDDEFSREDKGSETQGKQAYVYYPIHGHIIRFKVKTHKQVEVILSETASQGKSERDLEVSIGQKSVIKPRQGSSRKEVDTPDILSKDEFRGFWIEFKDDAIHLGKENEATSFLTWSASDFAKIRFLGVSVDQGDEAPVWIVGDEPSGNPVSPGWVLKKQGYVPEDKVLGGYEKQKLYVCRARFEGSLTPGKIAPTDGYCSVAAAGSERHVEQYEVLTGSNIEWVKTTKEHIPHNSVVGGHKDKEDHDLYICRVSHEESIIIGVVHPTNGCYIPLDDTEKIYNEYEILVEK